MLLVQDSYSLAPEGRVMGLIDLTHKGPKFPRPLVAMPNLKDLITSLPDKVRLEVNDRLQEQ